MQFEWDEHKNEINIRKHKIDFVDVPSVFTRPIVLDYDDRDDYGEERWIGIGLLQTIIVVVIFTEPESNVIRIISARRADQSECKKYYEQVL